jgi:hypothetical protein
MAANINAFFEEIKRTNWRDPGTWHFAPKTLVLLAVLVGIPVAGFFLDTRSQIGELEKGQADEQTLSGKAAMGVAALARGNATPVILLCGGLGLVLAQAVVFPGRHTRLRNLALRGREAGVVMIGAVLLFSGLDVVTAFTAAMACLNNIGPGLGRIGPASNYSVRVALVLRADDCAI